MKRSATGLAEVYARGPAPARSLTERPAPAVLLARALPPQMPDLNCHVVGELGPGTVQQGPPSFRSVARSGFGNDQLRAFLSHPHGAMPDLTLSRAEIDDLLASLASLK